MIINFFFVRYKSQHELLRLVDLGVLDTPKVERKKRNTRQGSFGYGRAEEKKLVEAKLR